MVTRLWQILYCPILDVRFKVRKDSTFFRGAEACFELITCQRSRSIFCQIHLQVNNVVDHDGVCLNRCRLPEEGFMRAQ